MKYQELIDMGFKRNEELWDDDIYFKIHGFNCFWLEKTLLKEGKVQILIEWEPTEGKMELITCKKHNVLSRREITEDELKTLVAVTKRQGDLPKKDYNYVTMAC